MKKNKVLSMLLSLAIALGLWLYVVTTVSTETTETYNDISVTFEGESILAERNLMITSGKDFEVDLRLTGSRGNHKKITTANDISLKVDLTRVYDPGELELSYKISYPNGLGEDAFEIVDQYPDKVKVTVEKKAQRDDVPVKLNYSGSAAEGFICDTENAVLDYPYITVIGPNSVVELIDHARIDVDLNGRTESLSENFRYTLCDAAGEPVDVEFITTNVAEIHLDLKIHRFKDVPLELTVTYGGGATRDNTTIKIEPATVRVSGSEALLDELEKINLGSIDLSVIETNTEQTFAVNLQEGIANESGVTEAKVTVTFNGLSTKEFEVTQIKGINVPEGMEYVLVNEVLKVKLRGLTGLINSIEPEDITATIDFSGKEAGTFTYKPVITIDGEEYASIGPVGSYSISATLQPEGTEE